jgi:hypothetical protein
MPHYLWRPLRLQAISRRQPILYGSSPETVGEQTISARDRQKGFRPSHLHRRIDPAAGEVDATVKTEGAHGSDL